MTVETDGAHTCMLTGCVVGAIMQHHVQFIANKPVPHNAKFKLDRSAPGKHKRARETLDTKIHSAIERRIIATYATDTKRTWINTVSTECVRRLKNIVYTWFVFYTKLTAANRTKISYRPADAENYTSVFLKQLMTGFSRKKSGIDHVIFGEQSWFKRHTPPMSVFKMLNPETNVQSVTKIRTCVVGCYVTTQFNFIEHNHPPVSDIIEMNAMFEAACAK